MPNLRMLIVGWGLRDFKRYQYPADHESGAHALSLLHRTGAPVSGGEYSSVEVEPFDLWDVSNQAEVIEATLLHMQSQLHDDDSGRLKTDLIDVLQGAHYEGYDQAVARLTSTFLQCWTTHRRPLVEHDINPVFEARPLLEQVMWYMHEYSPFYSWEALRNDASSGNERAATIRCRMPASALGSTSLSDFPRGGQHYRPPVAVGYWLRRAITDTESNMTTQGVLL